MNKNLYPYKFFRGYPQINPVPFFNLSLLRTVDWNGGDIDEVTVAAKQIVDIDSWIKTFNDLGDKAMADHRVGNAIAYYRWAEGYMPWNDPRKTAAYDKHVELFYKYYAEIFDSKIKLDRLPYGDTTLPVWIAKPKQQPRGAIVLHGGYDSYLEEFLQIALYLTEAGYAVYAFEGPGQGQVVRKSNLTITPDWHKVVGALLDHYELDDVTLIGASLGGALAPRAAAGDQRIKRVIAWGVMPNFLNVLLSTRPKFVQALVRIMLKAHLAPVINLVMSIQAKTDPMAAWGVQHGMKTFGAKSAYDFMRKADKIQIADIGDKITGDVLIIGSDRDHFVPPSFYKPMIDAMPNARTLTYRLFTQAECSGSHCVVGNTRGVLDLMIEWISSHEKEGH
ncbi:alpha/beta fold hydrolase [Candidatus Saccharibacteria bacterium]|nr:alpha/beta fold hydrolase [Candidatus Saccharibacteria bacterium]